MADLDDRAAAAADEARRARQVVERNVDTLGPMLESLGYRDDRRLLEEFEGTFDEYRQLDDEILALAIENTNLKAQRLSFGRRATRPRPFGRHWTRRFRHTRRRTGAAAK